jgi:hypothetical protein
LADTYTYSSADLHAVPNLHALADTHTYFSADIHTMAHVDTYTCAYCHGGAYTDADRDCANTDCRSINAHPGTNGYGSTNAYADRNPADGDTGANSYCCAYSDTCANGHTHAYTGA